jgi:hypothetical protein
MHPTLAAAAEPARLLVVVENHHVAATLPPLPDEAAVAILIEHEGEPFDAINARALKMRGASHVIYSGGCESLLSAIFRERLQNHGAVAIDVRTHCPTRRFDRPHWARPAPRSLVKLLEKN